MTPEQWKDVQELFERVSDLQGDEREKALLQYCNNPDLEAEVRRLLANLDDAGEFLQAPPREVAALRHDDEPAFQPGDHISARFEVIRLLGRGGMGEVYEAQDHTVGERVALKTLRHWLVAEAGALKRLREELRRARRITHPNVCRLHELFETHDESGQLQMFFTMELLGGETLAARLQRAGPMDPSSALSVLTEMAMGLEAAHKAGLLHRDLKPSNIFLSETPNGDRVVITDFGLAYRFDDKHSLTQRSSAVGIGGTPGYMAPEQYTGGELTPRIDVYAMGVIAYELIYGISQDKNLSLKRDARLGRWNAAIAKATSVDPLGRYHSPSQFVSACHSRALSRRGVIAGAATAAALCGSVLLIPHSRRRSAKIAVLPFEAAKETDEHWADGLTDVLIRLLRANQSLEVMGRDSVSRYKDRSGSYYQASRDLDVQWLIGGSVGRYGNDLQIFVKLVRSRGSAVFWSATFRNRPDQLSSLSLDIAKQIEGQLTVSLAQFASDTPSLQTNQDALDHYLKGRSLWNRRFADQLLKAREEFEKSIAADPAFALAYSGLADVLSTLADYHSEPPASVLPKAKQSALMALGLNSRLADCHVSFAHATALNDADWSTADISFRRAIALDNRHPLARQWYSVLLMKLGLPDECLAQARELTRLDPFSISAHRNLCLMLYFNRHYTEALDVAKKVFEMSPQHFGMHELAGECYARVGDRVNALRECNEALRQQQTPGLAVTWAAAAYAILGIRDEAERLISALSLNSASIRFQPTNVARAWAELREMNRAFEWLERAFLERDTMLQVLPVHASFDVLRLDPRYPPFLAKLRITYPQAG